MNYSRYWIISAACASAVLYHAFATRQHFYPTALYLSTSKLAVAVVGNLAFASALVLHQLLIKIFLGSLRDIEQELIRERLSSAIMESLLALTIFREEFSGFFLAMFAGLVFVKVLHWLVQDRVDYIEVTPSVSRLQHLRIVSFMSVLLVLDCAFLQYTVSATIASGGQSVMLLFAFEYVIQASDVIRYFVKYVMSMLDLWLEGRWEGKGTCVFYLDLITDLLHLFVYVVFFIIVFTNYGLPLHLVRDLYSTFRNFRNRVLDFLRFRQVSARLDRLPDASADDLSRSDGVCIICREEMSAAGSNKKLFCGHVFHTHCLRSWLERQQNCPTCRGAVFQRRADARAAAAAAAAAGAVPAQQQAQQADGAAADALAGAGAAPADAAGGAARAGATAGAPAGTTARAPGAPPGAHAHHHMHHPHAFHVPAHHHGRGIRFRPPGAATSSGTGAGAADAAAAAAPAPNSFMQLAGLPASPLPNQGAEPLVNLPPGLQNALWEAMGLPGPAGAPAGATLPLVPAGFPFLPAMPPPLLGPTANLWPTLMPPLTPAPAPGSMLEQQAAAAAAAAALAAAAAVGAYNPLGGLVWMPSAGQGLAPATAPAAAGAPSAGPSVSAGAVGEAAVSSDAPAAGSSGATAAPLSGVPMVTKGVEDELLAALGRVASELNLILSSVAQLKQGGLARQLTGQMQVAMANTTSASSAVAASELTSAPAPLADSSISSAPTTSVAPAAVPAAPATSAPTPAAPAAGSTSGAASSSTAASAPVSEPSHVPSAAPQAGTSSTASATTAIAAGSTGTPEAVDPQEEIRRKRLAALDRQQQV